jgi:TP901 family phage tail tape measure protein
MAKAIQLTVETNTEQAIRAGVKAAGTLNVPINATFNSGSFNNLAQPLGRVTGLATEFEKSIAASNARVIAFGASVGIINGIQDAFKNLVTTTIEVQKNLALIGAISDKSGAELEKFGNNLFEVAKNTGQSFKTAAEAATEFARQGLSVEQTLKRTSDALTLTRFTSLSAADSVEVLTAAVNSFGSAGITTTEILNKLVAVDSKFAVSAADLANGLSRTGSVAEEVGVSLDQLNGIITSVQEKTARGGAVIGNAFKTIFTNIRSEGAIKALENIGIYSKDAEGNLKPVIPVLQELSAKLNSLSGVKKIEVLESIASKYNINVLSALLSDINNAGGTYQKSTAASAGATNEAYSRQLELNKALSVAINNVFVSSEKLANSIGKIGVTDNLKGLLDFFSNFINSITDVIDSEGVGGKIAKGLISGLGGIFFKVGIPVLTGLFIVLTKNILQFGAESLQTILSLNSKVKEREALEKAVFNTLVKNQDIMANMQSLSGSRAKQEKYLLDLYNDQLVALENVKKTAAAIAPGLQSAGFSASSGELTKKGKTAAGGYLPAKEAADVSRGVGGASPSSKVVSIPNFAFGGGKKGTMIANTSEYIVPNFANGGSAIFNQDMISSFGLPAGARKLSAAGGYIPNFAKYIYDSDRIPADKNATLKAILASSAKKNLIIGPAGSGKSTMAAGMGTFLTGAADVANATEIDILSAAGRTKDGGLSKNLESIMAAVNGTGGKVSYLYTKNFDILSRRGGRTDPSEGDLRSKKQIAGTAYAPLNQYDFMSMVKSKAQSFDMIKAARGFIPNFAQAKKGYIYEGAGAPPEGRAQVITSLGAGFRGVNSEEKLIAAKYRLMDNTELSKYSSSKSQRKTASSNDIAAMLVPNTSLQYSSAEPKDPENQTYASVEFPIYKLSEQGLKNQTSNLGKKPEFFEALREQVDGLGIQLSSQLTGQPVSKDVYDKAFAKSLGAKAALDGLAGGLFETSVRALTFPESIREKGDNTLDFPDLGSKAGQILKSVFNIRGERAADLKGSDSGSIQRKFASQVLKNGLTRDTELPKFKASGGYIPNFAADPLRDAVQREIEAGLDPAQIRVTKDARLKNAQNPSGLAVINTRDEPDGKVPNFAKIGAAKAGYESSDPSLIASGSPTLPKDIQSNLIKAINAQIKAFETGTIDQNQLNAEVRALTDKTQLNKKSQEKIQSQVDSAVDRSQVSKTAAKGEKKEFDVGKFLLFQTAMAGATSAAQGFTKEGSTAAAGMETVSAGINILGTVAMVATTAMGPWGKALTIGATVISALIPVISKWSDALETDSDRTAKALADLGKQAAKTGEAITPEALLAALNTQAKITEEKTKTESIKTQLDKELYSPTLSVTELQKEMMSTILQGIGGIDENGKIKGNSLRDLVYSSKVPDDGKNSIRGSIDTSKLIETGKVLALKASKANVGKVQERQGGKELKSAAIEYENSLLTVQQQIQKSIFDSNIKSTNTYEKNLLAIEAQNNALERGKTIILEQQMFSLQKTQEETKADAEATKAKAENLNKLREKLTSIQGTTGQAFSETTDKQLQNLINIAERKGVTSTDFNQAFEDAQTSPNKVSLNSAAESKTLKETVLSSLQDQQNIDNNLNNQKKAIAQKYALSQTTLQKNIQETLLLNAITDGLYGTLSDGVTEFNGAVKYQELLNNQTSEYGKSLAELILKNKLSADSAKEKLRTDILAAQSNKESEQKTRENTKLTDRANLTQINLDKELSKKLDDLKQEGVNVKNKIQADAQLLDAETVLLTQYNDAYSSMDNSLEVDRKINNVKAKNIKTQRDLDIEQSVQLRTIRDSIDIDQAALKRKRELLEAQTKELSTKDYENQITEELNIEKEQLIQAIRKSIVGYGSPQALRNLGLKQKEQDIKSVDETIQKGKLYNGSDAFLQEQAMGRVLEQNVQKAGGIEAFSNLSSGERSNIISGKNNTIKQNLDIQGSGLLAEAKTFQQILGQDTPKALADGLTEAMKVGLSGADNIGEALQNVAKSFLQTIQSAMLESASKNIVGSFTSAIGGSQGGYVKKFAAGGMVTGGSGIRDDVPAMLSAGEYVMRKSAVQKYGAENIAKMNDGGIFLPGVRGGSAISGYDQLSKFANQTTTSGATDILQGTGSTAYANLEDQSSRLSRFGLMNEDTIKGEVTSAQQQGLDLIAKREAYRTQQRKAMQQQIISTVASIAVAYGAGKLGSAMKTKPTTKLDYGQNNFKGGIENLNNTVLNNMGGANAIPNDKFESLYFNSKPHIGVRNAIGYRGGAYGGMIAGFNNGGGPTDDIPALLMGGEYVMNRASTRKYGKQYLDSMNTGRARFADGGEVGMDATVESSDSKAKVDSKTGTAVNISINVSGSGSSTESQGQTSQGGVDYKKMGERIKAVVLETINEEKRLGGALRSR